MIRSFLVTFSDGTQAHYDGLSAEHVRRHLATYFPGQSFTIEVQA